MAGVGCDSRCAACGTHDHEQESYGYASPDQNCQGEVSRYPVDGLKVEVQLCNLTFRLKRRTRAKLLCGRVNEANGFYAIFRHYFASKLIVALLRQLPTKTILQ